MVLNYAECFNVYYCTDGYKLLDVKDGAQYLLVPDGKEAPDDLDSDVIVIHQPLERIYMAATSPMALFDAIDSLDTIRLSGETADNWYVQDAVDAMNAGTMITSRGGNDRRLRRFMGFSARPGRGGRPRLDLLVGVVFRRSRHHLDRVSDRGGFSGGGLLPAHRVGELSLGLRQGNYRLRQGDANGQQQPHRDEQPGPVPPLGSKAAAKQRACRQQHRYHQCHRQGQLQQGGHQSFHPRQLLSSSRARRCPAINSSSSARSRSVRSRLSTKDATIRRREDWYIFPKKLRLAQRR